MINLDAGENKLSSCKTGQYLEILKKKLGARSRVIVSHHLK